jgi:phosphoglycerate dehydrogenase-like enzyme
MPSTSAIRRKRVDVANAPLQDEPKRVRQDLTAVTNQRGNRIQSVLVLTGAGQIGQAIARRFGVGIMSVIVRDASSLFQ